MVHEVSFPEDIIFLILLFLPAAECHKLGLVCKSWYNMIKSISFIQAHLHCAKPGFICNKEIDINNSETPLRYFSEKNSTIWGSCSGLVLVHQIIESDGQSLFLANPATQDLMKLPSPTHCAYEKFFHVFGMSYMVSIKKYVVVHYFISHGELSQAVGNWFNWVNRSVLGCEILCVGDEEWKMMHSADMAMKLDFTWSKKVIFIDNIAHVALWEQELRNERCTSFVVSLDIADNKVYKTRVPEHHNELFDIRGMLSFAVPTDDGVEFEIWMLEDIQSKKWALHKRIEPGVNGFVGNVVATLEKGKIVIATYFDDAAMQKDEVGYFSCDMELKKMTYLDLKAHQTGRKLLPHVDSLLPCGELCS